MLSELNIWSGFRATGLILYSPERVLSCLTVVRTPSPPGTAAGEAAAWTAKTPRTTTQLEQQAYLGYRIYLSDKVRALQLKLSPSLLKVVSLL